MYADTLFIANKKRGLGILKIKDSYFNSRQDVDHIFNKEINEEKINYKQYGNEEIIHITKIPGKAKAILTICGLNNIVRYEVINLKELNQ